MKEVIAHYGIELPDERKGDKLKPKKPPPKDAPYAPVSGKKITKEEEEQKKTEKEAEMKKIQKEAEERVAEALEKDEKKTSEKKEKTKAKSKKSEL